jgi:cytochrome P450
MDKYFDNFNYELLKKIGSPCNKFTVNFVLKEINKETMKGKNLILYEKYQKIYCDDSLSSNMVVPFIDYSFNKEFSKKYIRDLTIINNPNDAERIVEKHIKKMPNLKPFVFDSIISTTDVKHWRTQRGNYQPAFSMNDSLKPIIPISDHCSKEGVDKLWKLSSNGSKEVNINEFFLNETHAQLQKAMFGFSDEFENRTNKKIRDTFSGDNEEYKKYIVPDLLSEVRISDGPLSKAMKERSSENITKLENPGNALIFSFAGHDTTGNTLTWLIYEISKNKTYQRKLQSEVDDFWLNQKEKEIEYFDFKNLPFMTRCIMETLRLRTPLPNGTFRELLEDDYITGLNGEKVLLKKGSYVQIPNIFRHINPKLWGYDAREFNPEREFKDEELWNNSVINSYNPCTERFSPFTYGPRDCIGKNFSQIEMRLMLLYLIKNFEFTLTEKQLNTYKEENMCHNSFTMGPRNIYNKSLEDSTLGMYVTIEKRKDPVSSKL